MTAMQGRLRIVAAAVIAVTFAIGGASAQTTPPEPFAPGAAAENAPPEAAKTETAKPAAEAPAPKRAAAPRRRAEGGAITVVVNNKRLVGLVQLTIGPAGGEAKKVAGPLAFGRKVSVRVKRAKDCLYDVRGHFADDADTEQLGVDLCKDKIINLTDD